MKYLTLLITGLLIVHYSHAQIYRPDTSLYKFEGTWVYTDSQQSFKIELTVRQKTFEEFNDILDIVEGNYIYILNKKVIVNTMDGAKPFVTQGFIINRRKSLNKMRFSFKDHKKKKDGVGHLEWVQTNGRETLLWTLRNEEQVLILDSSWDPSFSVPTKITLHRVEDVSN